MGDIYMIGSSICTIDGFKASPWALYSTVYEYWSIESIAFQSIGKSVLFFNANEMFVMDSSRMVHYRRKKGQLSHAMPSGWRWLENSRPIHQIVWNNSLEITLRYAKQAKRIVHCVRGTKFNRKFRARAIQCSHVLNCSEKWSHRRCKRNSKTIVAIETLLHEVAADFPKYRAKMSQSLWQLNLGINIDKPTERFQRYWENNHRFIWIVWQKIFQTCDEFNDMWLRVHIMCRFKMFGSGEISMDLQWDSLSDASN